MRSTHHLLVAACLLLAGGAAPAAAIVGGTDAPAGKYPAVANVVISGAFGCTGTLIAPDWVLTAGHCSSLTGASGVATPAAFPPASFSVVVGTTARSGARGEQLDVDRVVVPPDYLLTVGYDTSLLHLTRSARTAPTPVAGVGFEPLWRAGVLTEVVGFGVTSEGGEPPATLQQVRLPIVTDAGCAAGNGGFEPRTQLCAGYPEGGRDACQGDSGGPMFSRTAAGGLYVVGATSYGDGCAKANAPGVYARVADRTLREFIRATAPKGVADAPAGADTRPAETYDPATGAVTPAPTRAPGPTKPATAAIAPTATTAAGFTTAVTTQRTRRSTLRTRGLRFGLRCSAGCTGRVVLRVDAATARRLGSPRALGAVAVRRTAAGRSTATLRLPRALARRLTARRGARLRLEATVRPRAGGSAAVVARTVTLTGR